MAAEPVTVYFDTSFYVHLAKAPDHTAEKVIGELNKCSVQPVLSPELAIELLSYKGRGNRNRRLYERVTRLRSPLMLAEEFDWTMLLSAEHTPALADFLGSTNTLKTATRTEAMLGRRLTAGKFSQERADTIGKKAVQDLQQMGLATEESSSLDNVRNMLRVFGIEKSEEDMSVIMQSLCALDPDSDPSSHLPTVLQIVGLPDLGSEFFRDMHAVDTTEDAVMNDDRAYRVGVGEWPADKPHHLGNDFRDIDHQRVFRANHDLIHFLQVDHKHYRSLRHPNHLLAKDGLVSRCFYLRSLDSAASEIQRLLQEHPDLLSAAQSARPCMTS